MRRTTRLLLALLLAVAVAACGDDDTASPDDPVTDDPGAGDPGPADPTDPAADGPVTPTPGLGNPIPTAIDGVTLVADGDGRKLEVRFYNGIRDCYGLDRVEVDETDEAVTIGVFTGSVPPGDQVCIDIAELQTTVVTLEAALGDRAVVDASTGAPVAVG